MSWVLDSDRPIYVQLVEKIQIDIVSGLYKAGDKLPSVRELAAEATVNPNTMQKAFGELERCGLVFTQRTSGRFITEDISMIEELKKQLVLKQIQEFFDRMKQLGYQKEETVSLIQNAVKEEQNEYDTRV